MSEAFRRPAPVRKPQRQSTRDSDFAQGNFQEDAPSIAFYGEAPGETFTAGMSSEAQDDMGKENDGLQGIKAHLTSNFGDLGNQGPLRNAPKDGSGFDIGFSVPPKEDIPPLPRMNQLEQAKFTATLEELAEAQRKHDENHETNQNGY